MKVRIKNNRLGLENRVPNLDDVSESKLREIASKYQIGHQRFVTRDVEVMSRGRIITKEQQVVEPKTADTIRDEIRRELTITFYIPREYWTPEQEQAFNMADLINEKDINREQQVKQEAGIMVKLPPYEGTKDKVKEARFLTEITESQWEYLKKYYNTKYTRVKDDEGKTVGRKETYVHRLQAVEYIPENEEEKARIEEEQEAGKITKKKDAKTKAK